MRQIGCFAFEAIAVDDSFWRDLRKPTRSTEALLELRNRPGQVARLSGLRRGSPKFRRTEGTAATPRACRSVEVDRVTSEQEGSAAGDRGVPHRGHRTEGSPDAEPLEREARRSP